MKPPLGAPDRLVIRAKAWQQKTKRYREQSRSCPSTDPEPFASCCDRVSRCVVFGARIRGPNTGHAREAVNFDRWRVMVSFATCSFSVDEAFACLFTHRRVSVFIITRRIHSSQAFQKFRIEQARPFRISLPQTGVVSHQQARPFRISRPSHSVLISSRWVQQGSQVGSGQNSVRTQNQVHASQDHHQAIRPVISQDHNPLQLSSFLLSTSYRRWRAAIHVWLGRVQLIRSCIKGIGKYKQRRSQRTHT